MVATNKRTQHGKQKQHVTVMAVGDITRRSAGTFRIRRRRDVATFGNVAKSIFVVFVFCPRNSQFSLISLRSTHYFLSYFCFIALKLLKLVVKKLDIKIFSIFLCKRLEISPMKYRTQEPSGI